MRWCSAPKPKPAGHPWRADDHHVLHRRARALQGYSARGCTPNVMRIPTIIPCFIVAAALTACTTIPRGPATQAPGQPDESSFYPPNAEASRMVSFTNAGPAAMSILIQTHRAAVKETGPAETVAHFGEVYSFSPNFIAVHRDEPTQIRFWNLQPDDEHAFMLVDPRMNVLMKVRLPPIQETSFVLTFHQEGLFNFYCSVHQPSMAGQILVLPPRSL
jgi:plastocyanin